MSDVARGWIGFTLVALAVAPLAVAKEKLIVTDLKAGSEVTPEVASAMTEAVVIAAARPDFYQVVSSQEVQALIGVERQRQLLGCSDDSCMSEIGSALGARYLLRGSIGKLGASYQLALQLVDTEKAETVSRSARLHPSIDGLRARVPHVVALATGLPPPPAPSKVPAFSAFGGAAVLLVGSSVVGGLALAEEDALRREQERGLPGTLATRASYAEAQGRLSLQKTGAVAGLVAGAGLIALGVFLFPEDVAGDSLALSVGPSSISLAGVFQ